MDACHTVRVDKVVAGGRGLVRLAGGEVGFVHGGLPGERLRCRVRGRRRGVLDLELLEVLDPAPGRVEPPCPLAGRCGGCDLMHANPDTQARIKEYILAESLARAGVTAPVAAMPRAWPDLGYRQRLRLGLDSQGRPGLRRRASHELVPVQRCLAAAPEINALLPELPVLLAPLGRRKGKAGDTVLELECIADPLAGQAHLLLHGRPRPDGLAPGEVPGLASAACLHRGRLHPLRGKEPLAATAPRDDMVLLRPLGVFAQVHHQQNKVLVDLVLRQARDAATILDLYCGMGNFSLPLARQGARVQGVEQSRAAVAAARDNARRLGLEASFMRAEAQRGLARLIRRKERFDLVLLDPPRQGARSLMPLLLRLGPARILYVSCDPPTLARDLALLAPAYQPVLLQPLDMFPQTHHVECLAVLDRR